MSLEKQIEILAAAIREMMSEAGDALGRNGEYIDEIGRKALKEITEATGNPVGITNSPLCPNPT